VDEGVGSYAETTRHFEALALARGPAPLDNILIRWSHPSTVNLIKKLFSRHPGQETASSPYYNWPGQSGKEYHYDIYSFDTSFRPLPGNYIYAKELPDGDWSPIYIAQTRDLHQRLEGHVKLQDAIDNGATHLHAHYDTAGQAARCSEEHDLIQRWHPLCNDVFDN